MITKSFIRDIHAYFDEFHYHPTEFNINAFSDAVSKTLTHCASLEDAKNAILMAQYCFKNVDKITKMLEKKKDLYDEYMYEGNSLLSLLSDDESLGHYYITNGINNDINDVCIAGNFDDEDVFIGIDYSHGKYYLDDKGYYIKYSSMSSKKMKLFNKNNVCLCNIVLNDECDIFLENNNLQYELVQYESAMAIYDKEYCDSVNDNDELDVEKVIATIEWDLLDKNSKFGVSNLIVYDELEKDNFELISLLAASTFILFQKYMKSIRSSNMIFAAAASSNLTRIRSNNIRRF